jgi:CheY-like chemotaxis protein
MPAPIRLPRNILADWQVLVVDDDPGSLRVAEYLLHFSGASVHGAINGHEGLKMARILRPTFILSDISMPIMDGWELLHQLKREEYLTKIPVIALSAHALASDKQRGLAAGFHTYLTKPLNPMTFVRDLLHGMSNVSYVAARLEREGLKL